MGTKNNTSLIERHTSVAQNVTSSGVYVRIQCVCSPDKVECPHVGSRYEGDGPRSLHDLRLYVRLFFPKAIYTNRMFDIRLQCDFTPRLHFIARQLSPLYGPSATTADRRGRTTDHIRQGLELFGPIQYSRCQLLPSQIQFLDVLV